MTTFRERALDDPAPLVLAHRGASVAAIENTSEAFRLALEAGAEAIECDVRATRDGTPVVFHDAGLRRLAGRRGAVARLSFDALRRLELRWPRTHGMGSSRRRRPPTRGGPPTRPAPPARIETLENVVALVGGRCSLAIELKGGRAAARVLPDVMRIVAGSGHVHRLGILAWDPEVLAAVRRSEPRVLRGLLVKVPRAVRRGRLEAAEVVGLSRRFATPRHVARFARLGRPAWFYTLNDEPSIAAVLEAGARGVFSDDPWTALRAARTHGERELSSRAVERRGPVPGDFVKGSDR